MVTRLLIDPYGRKTGRIGEEGCDTARVGHDIFTAPDGEQILYRENTSGNLFVYKYNCPMGIAADAVTYAASHGVKRAVIQIASGAQYVADIEDLLAAPKARLGGYEPRYFLSQDHWTKLEQPIVSRVWNGKPVVVDLLLQEVV